MQTNLKTVAFILLILCSLLVVNFNVVEVHASFEDYTTYTESDGNSRLTVTASRITATDFQRDDNDTWVYDDKGVDYFTDFSYHDVDLNVSSADAAGCLVVWVLSNDIDDINSLKGDSKTFLCIFFYYISETYRIYLREGYGGNAYSDSWTSAALNTEYYLRIKKDGTTFQCGIYSTNPARIMGDATDGDLDNLALTLHGDWTFRYVFGVSQSVDGGSSAKISGYVENMDLTATPDETAPSYRSLSPSNGTGVSDELTISAELYDEIGLNWAWLATNETGSWVNYTNPYIHQFTYNSNFSGADNEHFWQGVATDTTYIYAVCSNYSSGEFFSYGNLTKYYKNGTYVNHLDYPESYGTHLNQCNSVDFYEDKLYVGASDYPGDAIGYIKVYNASTLAYIEEHYLFNHVSEGGTWYNGSFWSVWNDWNYVTKWDSSFNCVANYTLSYQAGGSGYQGARFWDNDYLYVNGGVGTEKLDVYQWNGSGFDEVVRLTRASVGLNVYCSQGFDFDDDGETVWFAERHTEGIAESWYTVCVNASIVGTFTPNTFGSPSNLTGNVDSWTWSNFTWSNSSLSSGTSVLWRVYFNDTSGNENATDIYYFIIGMEAYFYLFENTQLFSSLSYGIEISKSLFENHLVHSSLGKGIETSQTLFQTILVYDSVSKGIEFSRMLFENPRIWSSVTASFEYALLDLTFILFENPLIYPSLSRGIEIARSFSGTVNVWSSLATATEGIVQDLAFILFETVMPLAVLISDVAEAYVLADALALGAIAFVLAIVAICLLFAFKKES